jgi:Glycine rich protein
MISLRLGEAPAVCAVALLAGCGASQMPTSVDQRNPDSAVHRFVHTRTFPYTGAEQTFTVPKNVHALTVVADGASGGNDSASGRGGFGGEMTAQIPVTPGKRLAIFVGGEGLSSAGGYNGGGNGQSGSCSGDYCAEGGGGASDVRDGGDALSKRVIVAAGGGGEGYNPGGDGGGRNGLRGEGGGKGPRASGGGFGGSQTTGGAGGKGAAGRGPHTCHGLGDFRGSSGSLGHGGAGGAPDNSAYGGGGGGGGYYGGGGGGGGCSFLFPSAGGGGGSSYAERSATHVHDVAGAREGNGEVIIFWTQ